MASLHPIEPMIPNHGIGKDVRHGTRFCFSSAVKGTCRPCSIDGKEVSLDRAITKINVTGVSLDRVEAFYIAVLSSFMYANYDE